MNRSAPNYLIGVGIAFVVVQLLEVLLITFLGEPLVTDGEYLIGVATTLLAGAIIAIGAYWVNRTAIRDELYPRLLWWCAGVSGVFLLFSVLLVITMADETVIVRGTVIRWAISIGAALGLLLGLFEIRAIHQALETERAQVRAKHLEEQRDLLDYVNSVLRHEVINQTIVIEGYSTQLLDNPDLSEDDRRWITHIHNHSQSIAEIIEDVQVLLEATAVDDEELDDVDLVAVLEDEIDTVESRCEALEVDTYVPSRLAVKADQLLRYVFGNLLANAVEHNTTSSPRIQVAAEQRGDIVRVYIRDNGPGISDSAIDTLFDRSDGNGESHGLGMYIVDQLLDRYDGSIEIVETGPRGTLFAVDLRAVTEALVPLSDVPDSLTMGSDWDE